MLKKIYQELVAIRKELQAIRSDLELKSNIVLKKKIQSQLPFAPEKISTLDIVLDEEKMRNAIKNLYLSI